MSQSTNTKPTASAKSAGFSILEVLITAAIIGVITGLVVLKYGAFNNLILLKNQAFQISIDLRETQNRALSSLGRGGTAFRDGYGIYFSLSTPDRYVIFIDTDNDNSFDANEELETRRLDSRFILSQLCNGGTCTANTMAIVFRRPNFDAIINNGNISNGRIEIVPKNGAAGVVRAININAAGQISVQ